MKTIKDFIEAGVYQTKMIESKYPSVTWSLSRKRLVNGNDVYELIEESNGNKRISIENNIMVNLKSYSELTRELVEQINNSEDGAIIMNDERNFRFDIIPTKEFVEKNYIKV